MNAKSLRSLARVFDIFNKERGDSQEIIKVAEYTSEDAEKIYIGKDFPEEFAHGEEIDSCSLFLIVMAKEQTHIIYCSER